MPAAPYKSVLGLVKPIEQSIGLVGILVVATQTKGGSSSSWALTDKNGMYSINSGLKPGTYNVTAGVYDCLVLGETAGYVGSTTTGVNVTAGQETVNTDFNLLPSGWISGNVTSPNGTPIFRALVTANATYGGSSGYEYTDATGFYRITTGLESGTYSVTASYQGHSQSKQNVVAVAGNETTNTNFQLSVPAGGEVIGRVTNAVTGKPIGHIGVQISGPTNVEVLTDLKGYYSSFVSAGSYVVTTSVPGFVNNKTNVQVTTNKITRVYYPASASLGFLVNQLSGTSSGKIAGTVTGSSTPAPEFPVTVLPAIFSIAIFLILLSTHKHKRARKLSGSQKDGEN